MLITKCIIELTNISLEELQQLENLINTFKSNNIVLQSITTDDSANNSNNSINTVNEHFLRLKKFRDNLTKKQHEVFDFFMTNPGPLYGDDIRKALTILQPQGALSGVFRAKKHWVSMGGQEMDCPFFKSDWDEIRRCGIYRGLRIEEIQYLNTV